MTGTPPDLVAGADLDDGPGGSAATSLLDSWSGRWRARLVLGTNRLAERWPKLTVLPGARQRGGTTIRGFAQLPVRPVG